MYESSIQPFECLNRDIINLLHKNQVLNQLVRNEVTKEVLREVQIDEKESKEILEKFRKNLNLNNEDEFSEWLSETPFNHQDINDTALYKKRLAIYCDKNFSHKVEAHFLKRKKDLDIVIYSLIRISDYFKAKELYYRAYEGEEDFGELAKQHSEGMEKKTRGIVGPVPVEKSHPQLKNLLRTSKPGEIQQPFQIDTNFVIIRVESFDSAKLDNYMREKMNEELFNEWIIKEVNELSSKLIEQVQSNNHK